MKNNFQSIIPHHPNELISTVGTKDLEGIKITFINMPLRESMKQNAHPEGIAILASIVRNYGAEPYIIDLNGYRIKDDSSRNKGLIYGRQLTYDEAENLISKHLEIVGDQDIIALSGKITTLRWQEKIAKIVRKLQPDCFLVTGNGLATEIKMGLFNWIPELDGIGRSEGDDVIIIICKDAKSMKEKGKDKAKSSGILSPYYVGEYLGKDRFIYEGNRPKNLDIIPFAALDLFEHDPFGHNLLEDFITTPVWGVEANNSSATSFTMKRSLTTVSSRGCPYACTFCYRGAQGERNYGMRSAQNIASQIKLYVDKYDVDFIGFSDDNFAVDKRRIAKMPNVFREYGVDNVRWGTHTRMDEADDRAFLMAESGCVYIGFGAESADVETLTNMKKGGFILSNGTVDKKIGGSIFNFPKTMVNAIENCKSSGIHPNCTWIMGYPSEKLLNLKTSIAFILWQKEYWTKGFQIGSSQYDNALQSVNARMFTATAYPGTELWRDVRPKLTKHFNISFDSIGEPICDDNFRNYVLELDDATKILNDNNGNPVNYSDIPQNTFLKARNLIDNGELEKVLEL